MAELTTKKQAYQIVSRQIGLIVVLAVLLAVWQGTQAGFSALLGGLAYCLPTLLFVWRVFARTSVRFAKQFVVAFFAGELLKLLLSAVLFVLVVNYLPVKFMFVLAGFVGAVIAFWIASVSLLTR